MLRKLNILKHLQVYPATIQRLLSTAAPAEVTLTDFGVLDGNTHTLHQESRELCRCEKCWQHFNEATMPLIELKLSSKKIKAEEIISTDENFVSIRWTDGHVGLMPRNDISAFSGNSLPSVEDHELSLRQNHRQRFWAGDDYPGITQKFEYKKLQEDPKLLKKFIAKVFQDGFASMTGVPSISDEMKNVAKNLKIGQIVPTNYGEIFNIYDMGGETFNLGFTDLKLAPHTDIPYFSQPPSILFLHCLKGATTGGQLVLSDGFAAAGKMKKDHPDEYRTLLKHRVTFRDFRNNCNVVEEHSIIGELQGHIHRIVCNPPVYNPWDFIKTGTLAEREEWHAAWMIWRGYIDDPNRQISFAANDGDLTVVDNWRVLHGRYGFTGKRHVQGGYIEYTLLKCRFYQLHGSSPVM